MGSIQTLVVEPLKKLYLWCHLWVLCDCRSVYLNYSPGRSSQRPQPTLSQSELIHKGATRAGGGIIHRGASIGEGGLIPNPHPSHLISVQPT